MTREEAILVLHDMKDTYDEIHENTNFEIGYEQMTALDMATEALSAEAVQGEWIMHGEPPWYVRECSKCGTKWHQWSGDKTPNYCGHCGAKMKRR